MHYYQFNIGDYAKYTRHLNLIEDLAYRRLIDHYYLTEKPLALDVKKLSRLIGMQENKEEVSQVLDDFFLKSEDGYYQNRINEEIIKYHSRADSARANGKKGGRPKKPTETQSVNLANPDETESKAKKSESKANQEPLTTNQEPLTKDQETLPTIVSDDDQSLPDKKISDEDVEFSKWFYEKLVELNPKQKKPNFNKWADTVRLIRSVDKKSYQEMSDLFMWVNSDDFWKGNILSPIKLRKHWDMLVIRMNKISTKNDINAIDTDFSAPEDWNNENINA